MKFSILAVSAFAAAVLAAPVAEAEAAAAPAPVAEAEADPEAFFLSALLGLKSTLFGINAGCDSCSGNVGGISIGVSAGIFITPTGEIIYGNTIPGCIPFQGTVINGNLYCNAPFLGNNGYGCVNFNSEGRLYVGKTFRKSCGWYIRDENIFPSIDEIYAYPDNHGHNYIYCGGKRKHHHRRKHVKFHCHRRR